jgi:hypothetical protein
MLVLALQFSRSVDQRVRRCGARSTQWRLARGNDSLKTEEKTAIVAIGRTREENLRPRAAEPDDPPVHQLGCPNAG